MPWVRGSLNFGVQLSPPTSGANPRKRGQIQKGRGGGGSSALLYRKTLGLLGPVRVPAKGSHSGIIIKGLFVHDAPVPRLVKRKLPRTSRRCRVFFLMSSLDHGESRFTPILQMAGKGLDEFALKCCG